MKTPIFALFLFPALVLSLRAQSAAGLGEYRVTARGPHHRVVERAVTEVRNGKTVSRTERYTELATGMHVLRDEVWQEASDQLAVLPDQSAAVLTNAPYQAALPADLYHGALGVTTPDGARLSSRPLAIAYFDGTNIAICGELKPCSGELLRSGNQVLWPDAFTTLQADILASCSRAGIQCDLVLRSQPPPPESFGLSPDSRLQLWTEFFEGSPQVRAEAPGPAASTNSPGLVSGSSPASALDSQVGAAGAGRGGPQLPDVTLRFGQSQSMRMGLGKAFRIGPDSPGTNTHRVFKSWHQLEGRTFLIEEIPLPAIRAELEQLHSSLARPTGETLLAATKPRAAGSKPPLPPARPPQKGSKTMLMAKADVSAQPGFLVDYELNGAVGDFVLTNSETFFVSGPFYVAGTLTVEPCVVKFADTNTARISFSGPLACRTDFYQPCILTSQNDNSVGSPIPGSTGSPGRTAATYFEDTSRADSAFRHLRFSYAGTAVSLTAGWAAAEFWHCQFVDCASAISANVAVSVYNALFARCGTALASATSSARASQCTFDQCDTLAAVAYPQSSSLTNCLLTGVTNVNSWITRANCREQASGAGMYQAVGGAGYYLAPNSPARGGGSTNLHPALLSDLRRLTTEPPVVLDQTMVTTDTTLGPQAQRDWAGTALGYHYTPLDFLLRFVRVTNAALRVLPGTALGSFGNYGLALRGGGRFRCEGQADNLIHFARYNLVQEDSITNWDGKGASLLGNFGSGESSLEVTARFTDFSMPARDGDCFAACYGSPVAASFRDCHFHGGTFQFGDPAVTVTNCLFEGVSVYLADNGNAPTGFQNCLFGGGSLALDLFDPASAWVFRDNLFTGTLISQSPDTPVTHDHNGYTPGSTRLTPTNASDVVTALGFESGPLGRYYLPTNSPLVNAGAELASALGLYHFTSQVEQRKEANSTTDLSFHYLALASATAQAVWVDDAYPTNSALWGNDDIWTWTNNPTPAAGGLCHQSSTFAGMHQHVCYNWPQPYPVGPDYTLFCYVRLDAPNLPTELMLQWQAADGTYWSHRAFWGADNITDWGPRTYMGPLPATNCWVRLEVPARAVDLVGRAVNGMAFTLYGGTAAWDHAGMVAGARLPVDTDADGLSDVAEDLNGDGLYTPALGETGWTNYTSANGLTPGSGLEVFTPLK